jgi:branched-chain amino acid transport system ATP-binding protein
MALLDVAGLDAQYGRIKALQDVTLRVEEGEIVTLIGANGAGKTTTLRAISGLLKSTHGSVRFAGREISRLSPDRIVRLGLGHSPEGRRVFARMSVRDNLELGAYTRRVRAEIAADMAEVFATFPRLLERADQRAGTLSGGEQQMLAIGRALMSRPRLLMLDEPSLGLSPLLVETIFAVIKQIKARGTTILLIEQNARQALGIADRGYVLEVGRVVYADRADVLLASEAVRSAYLGGGGPPEGRPVSGENVRRVDSARWVRSVRPPLSRRSCLASHQVS